MKDDENPSDYIAQHGKPTSLPPAAKVWREALHGLRDIALPCMALLAAKWGLVSGEVFAMALAAILGGNMALRRGEQSDKR
jgi:hypothetical protein